VKRNRSRRTCRLATGAAVLVATVLPVGCGGRTWRAADGTVVTGKIDYQKEPVTGRTFHLYVPHSYDPRRAYPLVITGHGMFPFDHAMLQRDRWVDVAETSGLIICSPDLDSATAFLRVKAGDPPAELLRDEKAVLTILDQVKSRYNIREDAVALTGWSAGGYAAQFIGLRHPETFRCVIGRTPNFSEHLVTDAQARRARHMHVYLFYGKGDMLPFEVMSRDAACWYTTRGFRNFIIKWLPGGHNPNQQEASRYLLDIFDHWPAIRMQATHRTDEPATRVRFTAHVDDPDAKNPSVPTVVWNFGDDTTATGRNPVHDYARPGTYEVRAMAVDSDGHCESTQVRLAVGGLPEVADSRPSTYTPPNPTGRQVR